ncbi:MAG TPA: cobalt-precorrin-6A reductase [Thermosynechococcaceae cyanobacterium]
MKRVLLLGGTTEATELAAQATLLEDIEVISSLAGRTQHPTSLPGTVRVGGFGGEAGLADYLRAEAIDLLIDATHPFAAQISHHSAAAAARCQIPRLMITRPPWQPEAGDRWVEVVNNAAAAQVLPSIAKRVFLTIGRQDLATFAPLDLWFLMRMIDPPSVGTAIPNGLLLQARGPFEVAGEKQLLTDHAIEAIVSKNSGGEATYAKIIAAREIGVPVVMVQRSPLPPGAQVATVAEAIAWLRQG